MAAVRFRPVALLVSLATVASAQSAWTVNRDGSGDFTDLCIAIQAATSGDTIVIQGGGEFDGNECGQYRIVVDRSLRIVGDAPRPSIAQLLLEPGVELALSGLSVGSIFGTSMTFHGEGLELGSISFHDALGSLTDCTSSSATLDTGSSMVFSGCSLTGMPSRAEIHHGYDGTEYCTPVSARPALIIRGNSRAVVTDCTLVGGAGGTWCQQSVPDSAAIEVGSTSAATITGSTLVSPAIINAGPASNVEVDLGMTLDGSASSVLFAPVPKLVGKGALPGGTVECSLRSDPGRLSVIAAALGFHAPVASELGLLWLDPGQAVGLALKPTDASGSLAVQFPVPLAVPRGLILTVQGATLVGGTTLTATTPTVLMVR